MGTVGDINDSQVENNFADFSNMELNGAISGAYRKEDNDQDGGGMVGGGAQGTFEYKETGIMA